MRYTQQILPVLGRGGKLPPSAACLREVRLHSLPHFDPKTKSSDPWLEVRGGFQGADVMLLRCRANGGAAASASGPLASALANAKLASGGPVFDCQQLELSGDFKIIVYDQVTPPTALLATHSPAGTSEL